MKRFLLLLSAVACFNFANSTTVLFAVDMTGQTVHANGMHIAGSFQSWNPSATALSNLPTTQVYYYSFTTTTPGKVEYKFINGSDWGSAAGTAENVPTDAQVGGGNGNRWYTVDTTKAKDTILVSWQGLSSSAFAAYGYNKQYVRIRVNMAKAASIDAFGILAAGAFNGWSDKSQLLNLDASGKVYEGQMWLSAGNYEYKFKNGTGGWESVPGSCAPSGGNRVLAVTTSALVLTPVCFSECSNCILNLPKYDVTFNTDLAEELACGTVDSVDVTGGHALLGNWGNPGQKMAKVGATSVYTLKINQFDSGTSIDYKYRVWSKGVVSWEQIGWISSGNRALNIVATSTLPVNCFGKNTTCTAPPASSKVTFKVDFAGTTITPGTKIYLVGRGSNAWLKGATAGKIEMTAVPNTGGKAYQISIDSICPGTIYYNFANDASDETYDTAASGRTCLSPSGIGYQRVYARPAGASTVYYVFGKCVNGKSAIDYTSKNESFRMYPNPMTTSTSVEVGNGTYTINIIDMTGKMVRTYEGVSGKLTINKDDLPTGIYIIDVMGDNSRTTEKLSIK